MSLAGPGTSRWRSWYERLIRNRLSEWSIAKKIGIVFAGLTVIFGGLLVVNSYLTSHLMGTSAAINHAGSERMRIYKLAYLIERLERQENGRSAIEDSRDEIHREMQEFERVLEGLQDGTDEYGPLGTSNPAINVELQRIRIQWETFLRPAIDQVVNGGSNSLADAAADYTNNADEAVAALSEMVHVLEKDVAGRIATLYGLQLLFLLLAVALYALAMISLRRVIRDPLHALTRGAEQLAGGSLNMTFPVHQRDELGQLARTFEWMAQRIRSKIEHIEALHATGQEITTLGSQGVEQVLRRIADRAADVVQTDLAVLMVRHPILECWVVEAASGKDFDVIRQEILLFEETPFSNQAFETNQPVVVADLRDHADKPVRFRDEFGAKSYMAVPLRTPHETIGVLVLLSTGRVKPLEEWDIPLAQQFASYAAITIENARLFDAAEAHSRSLRLKLAEMERNVAELTHEVKAPAGRVAEFASWIEEDYRDRLDEKAMRYLAWIQKEGTDLAHLAERTLDFARVMHEQRPLESVDTNAVVQEVLERLVDPCTARGITIHVEKDLPRFACQRIHLKQVVENLVNNAVKYMGEQTDPCIEIGARREAQGTFLIVRDNGIGIDPDMTERIFQPFQRLGTVEVSGAGIGLSIVKTVVEHYGGTITVESGRGEGSTFSVRLPVLSDEAVKSAHE